MATCQNTETPHFLVSMATGAGNYWFSFVSDPLTIVFFLFWETFVLRTSIVAVAIVYSGGLASWTLLEYSFHRWVYHKGHTPAHVGHKKHHESPTELIAMPWFIITAFLGSVWYLFAYRWQLHHVLPFMGGLTTGFVCYGLFHHVHHHFHFKNRRYRKLRAHHFIHHQFPEVNFGVTSRFWDHVFGTTYRRELKRAAPPERTSLIVEEVR